MENGNIPASTTTAPVPTPGSPGMEQPTPPLPALPQDAPVNTPVIPQKGSFFREITLMDVGMVALVTLALLTSIYVNRKHLLMLQDRQNSNGSEIDEIKANLQTVMGSNYKSF